MKTKKDKVICKICKKKFDIISATHIKNHNMTITEYKEMFPNSKTISDYVYAKIEDNLRKGRETMERIGYTYKSIAETELSNFLNALEVPHLSGNRKLGCEFDILIPDYGIAIEYNGNVWHSEYFGGKDRNYHARKTDIAESHGYQLIHIYDDEYKFNKRLVYTKIAYILGFFDGENIYGRKCKIKTVPKEIKKQFLNTNHIQGNSNSTYDYGLYYNDELVSLMSFSKYTNKNKTQQENVYELVRFATDNEYKVIGGASKLLKHFYKNHNPSSVISFADLRWSNKHQNLYTSLGFKQDCIIAPDYYYLEKFTTRHHKFKFSKANIKKKYPDKYDETLSESENMKALGYDRTWDVGKVRYVMNEYVKPKPKQTVERKPITIPTKTIIYEHTKDNRLIEEDELNLILNTEAKSKTAEYVESEHNNKSHNKDYDFDKIIAYKNSKISISLKDTINIIELYINEDMSLRKISKLYNFAGSTIKSLLEKNNVNINTAKRKYVGGKSIVDKRYAERNKEKLKAYHKEYREKNKEAIKERTDKWLEENKEHHKIMKQKKYLENKYGSVENHPNFKKGNIDEEK